jgi:hypothetical protein
VLFRSLLWASMRVAYFLCPKQQAHTLKPRGEYNEAQSRTLSQVLARGARILRRRRVNSKISKQKIPFVRRKQAFHPGSLCYSTTSNRSHRREAFKPIEAQTAFADRGVKWATDFVVNAKSWEIRVAAKTNRLFELQYTKRFTIKFAIFYLTTKYS